MIVDTRALFARLLTPLSIDAVCDVGSLNGADALRFREAAPAAQIHAFEAHPGNFAAMCANAALHEAGIELVRFAASDEDGEADFFTVPEGYAPSIHWRGMSSLHERVHRPEMLTRARVPTVRLDSFLGPRLAPDSRVALWLDVEGKSYEVIEGARSILPSVQMLHVEVETWRCIGAGQRLYPQVRELLRAVGFDEIATDDRPHKTQFNALFIRQGLPWNLRLKVATYLSGARIHRARVLASRILNSRLRGLSPQAAKGGEPASRDANRQESRAHPSPP